MNEMLGPKVPPTLETQLPGVPGLCTPVAQAPLEAQVPLEFPVILVVGLPGVPGSSTPAAQVLMEAQVPLEFPVILDASAPRQLRCRRTLRSRMLHRALRGRWPSEVCRMALAAAPATP